MLQISQVWLDFEYMSWMLKLSSFQFMITIHDNYYNIYIYIIIYLNVDI